MKSRYGVKKVCGNTKNRNLKRVFDFDYRERN